MKGDELRGRVHSCRSFEATGLPVLWIPLKHSGWKQRLYLAHNLETRNMGKFLPDSLSLMHVVLAGAAEIRERIPSGFLHSVPGASALLASLYRALTSEASPRGLLFSQVASYVSWSAGSLHEDGLSPRASLDPGFWDSWWLSWTHRALLPVRPAQIQRERSQRISAIWVCYRARGEFSAYYSEYNGRPPEALNMEIAGFWF